MKPLKIALICSIPFFLMCCGDPIDVTDQYNLDKNYGKIPKFAIIGRISNQLDSNCVKITRTISITSSNESYVDNATVTLSDNRGNSEQLTYVGKGRYQCNSLLGINDGRIYTMNATIEGKSYSANAVIPATPLPIDSATYIDDVDNTGRFTVLIYANVHTAFDEFYMFQYFANDTLKNKSDDILVADNIGLNGKIDGLELANNLKKGTRFRYKFFSISKDAFKFYQGINDQLNNDGGVFSSPPANVKGNIPDAAGIFQATYFTTDTLTIK